MIRGLVKQIASLILTIAVIVLIIFGGIKLWQKVTYTEPEGDAAIPVSVIEIDMPEVTEEAPEETEEEIAKSSKTAFVVADQEVEVFAEVSGVIKNLNISEGQEVKAGQAIATLGDSVQLQTAAASYNAALASLQNAQKQLSLAKMSTNVSLSTFQNQLISAENSIRQAAFQLEAGQDIRGGQNYIQDLQEKNQELQEKLQETASTDTDSLRSSASEQDEYNEYIQRQINRNNTSISKAQDEVADIQGLQQDSQFESQIRESKNQIDLLLKQMESTKIQGANQIVQIETQIVQLTQQLQNAQINLATGKITSPVSGVVTKMDVRTGDRVNPSVAMFTVTNLQSTMFQASLTPAEVIALGNTEVTIELFEQEIPAQIIYVGAVADTQTKTIPVKVIPAVELDLPLIPNTFARINFTEKAEETTETETKEEIKYPVVPVRIMKFDGGYNVPVSVEGVLTYKKVVLGGKIKNGLAPIKSGLQDGDLVIIDRINLEEGSLVQPI